MSAPNPLISPQTAAQTIQIANAQHADKLILYITGTWSTLEDATINVPTTAGGLVAVLDSTGAPVVIGNSRSYVELEGGYLYTVVKSGTLGAAGIDIQVKPRIGPH